MAPAAGMAWRYAEGRELAMDLLHPTGEMAVRLMVLAMLPGPLAEFFGHGAGRWGRLLRGWLGLRRDLGLAAFGYALLHLAFYWLDLGQLPAVLADLELASIWTGWLALGLMLVPAMISSDAAMRWLGRTWQRVQWLVYPAFAIGLVHWLLLGWDWLPAVVHAVPVGVAWLLRLAARQGFRPFRRA